MACLLTTGFNNDCKDNVGGVRTIWFILSDNVGTITITPSGTVTAWTPAAGSLFKYRQRKGVPLWEPKIVSDDQKGTTYYPGDLSISLHKMDISKRNELKLLAQNTPMAVIRDRNSQYWLTGYNNGWSMITGDGTTGQAMGDFSGWALKFTCEEEDMPLLLDPSVVAALALSTAS